MTELIRTSEVLRYLGYSGQEMDPALGQRIERIMRSCEDELVPRSCWRHFPVRTCEAADGIPALEVVGTTLVLRGTDITTHLAGASGCALMATTLGADSDRNLTRLGRTDPLDQLIYDASCTDLVERGADRCEAQVVAWAHAQGLYTSWRYGPGYGDLGLDVQPVLLDVIDAGRRIGVSATQDCLLVPAKSETGIIGLYPKPPSTPRPGCSKCCCREWCSIRAAGDVCYRRPAGDGVAATEDGTADAAAQEEEA